MIFGNGGLAWMTAFWPHNDIAAAVPAGAAVKPGGTLVQGTDNPLTVSVDAPWKTLPGQRQVTAFLCGNNETHTRNPNSTVGLNGNNIFAVASALQSTSPSVIPIISVGDAAVGAAPGSARPANVGDGTGIVGLFNSAASRAGGLLSDTNDAKLYKTQFDGFAQLNRAANSSTTKNPPATDVFFVSAMNTLMSGGIVMRNDWGRTMRPTVCEKPKPTLRAASAWPTGTPFTP